MLYVQYALCVTFAAHALFAAAYGVYVVFALHAVYVVYAASGRHAVRAVWAVYAIYAAAYGIYTVCWGAELALARCRYPGMAQASSGAVPGLW